MTSSFLSPFLYQSKMVTCPRMRYLFLSVQYLPAAVRLWLSGWHEAAVSEWAKCPCDENESSRRIKTGISKKYFNG